MKFTWVLYVMYILTMIWRNNASTNSTRLNVWLKSCQEEAGASEADYERVKMRKVPTTPKGICMVECIFERLHIIQDNRFSKQGFLITFSPITKGNLRKLAALKEIASVCQEELKDEDNSIKGVSANCDFTKLVLECFARNKGKLDLSKKA